MVTFIPITLVGSNLGERHRYLNSLVAEAHRQRTPFETIRDVPEQSPVDRLFKIELASRRRELDYIIRNLKDEDMLYVSKALKSHWLLDTHYSDIINPIHLENVLFPEMLTTAVNKMRHWIHLHLRDEQRCQEFYIYYKEKDFKIGIQFLQHCAKEFILNESSNILHKLTPQYLKLISEKCSQVAKLYYDNLHSDQSLATYYLDNEDKYYKQIKCLLKLNSDIFLDIIEKYFHYPRFNALSPNATKYIMKNKKHRFLNKPELYAAWLLNMKTLAKCLVAEEIKELVFKLARARYLGRWFSYKSVEALIKQLNAEERTLLKRQVFVEKRIGDIVEEWPYTPPGSPQREQLLNHILIVELPECGEVNGTYFRALLKKRKYGKWGRCETKTLLDKLFDQYRFVSFERTLYELRKQIASESNPQNREYMILVLVSKSGGRAEAMEALVRLLVERHSNELCTVRAAVVRSLVRRAAAWRLPPAVWELLMQFAHGLGLDGNAAETACREGMHAVVMRALLAEPERAPEPAVFTAYINQFSPLAEYALDTSERRLIGTRLPALLLEAARNTIEPPAVVTFLTHAFDTLDAYRLHVHQCPDAIYALAEFAHREATFAAPLLRRLFKMCVARRQLFRENFALVRTDGSYVNALRHDIALLNERFDLFKELVANGELRHEQFLRKLVLYFSEENGLAARHLNQVKSSMIDSKHPNRLARAMALLAGGELKTIIHQLDSTHIASSQQWRLAAALKAHAHAARPPLDLAAFGWRAAGVKAVANRVLVCSARAVPDHLRVLLTYHRWARLALTLALRCGEEVAAFEAVSTFRPGAALAAAVRYLRRRGDTADPRVWLAVRPLLATKASPCLDLAHPARERLRRALIETEHIPRFMKADYCAVIYNTFNKTLSKGLEKKLLDLLIVIETLLTEMDMDFIYNMVKEFLNDFLLEKNIYNYKTKYYFVENTFVYFRIIGKYLLLSDCSQIQNNRLDIVEKLFFQPIHDLWNNAADNVSRQRILLEFINKFLHSLKYTKVFLDVSYTSCIPVFERVIKWLQEMWPIEQWFNKYVCIHLTMLYFKTIRQSIKQRPEVFADEQRKLKEGVEIVGTIFGKYIAREISELTEKYFPTIKYIYGKELLDYIDVYFEWGGKDKFLMSMISGLLEETHNNGSIYLAELLFITKFKSTKNTTDCQQILNKLVDIPQKEMQFLLNADLYS